MTIRPIDVGEEPNDETGDTLRDGGIIINENFAELDTRTAAAQAKAEQGVADAAAAKAKADAAVPGAALGVSVAQLINGTVPAAQLPSFVDDVLEFPTRADFPATGETGKIYIAINDGDSPTNPTRQYRWSGAAYVLIPSSPGSTDQVPEGATNQYFTAARVRSTTLAGLGALVNAAIVAGDTVLQALAKLQGQLNVRALRGINSDITELAGLTTALSVSQGGTGGSDQASARSGLGLGTAATANTTTSTTDSTAGRVLRVGDLGLTGALPRAPAGTNANSLPGYTHRAWIDSTSTGGPVAAVDWIIEHVFLQSGYAIQRAQALDPSRPGVYTRAQNAGNWSDWVPSAIERVTNANGEATKFADGTMICRCVRKDSGAANTAFASNLFVSSGIAFTWPVPFVGDAPIIAHSSETTAIALGWSAVNTGPTLTGISDVRLIAPTTGATSKLSVIAVGRWK